MRALFIIDPIEKLKPYKDSSIDLMVVAEARGHEVAWCRELDVSAGTDGVSAKVRPLTLDRDIRAKKVMDGAWREEPARVEPLTAFDAIFIRKDPPFDMGYLSLCLLLDGMEGKAVFVNSPRALRIVSEKLSALLFGQAAPDTLMSYDVERLRAFSEQYDRVVLKPCYYGSGKGVVAARASDPDFADHVETILKLEPHGPVIAQAFIPDVYKGDARVMLVEGEVVGAVGRKPHEGEFRANIAAGGTEFAVELSAEQMATARKVGAFLNTQGVIFAGLDFIGSKLIEINVTSPTLIQELRRLGGPDVSERIWDAVEKRVKAKA